MTANPTAPARLFHGGVPGLQPGQLIEPGHDRRHHDGCPWCEARAQGGAHQGIDPLALPGRVYATSHRLYARHYASLWGRGTLYRVTGIGDGQRSTEDTIESWHFPALRVEAVLDRAVLLTMSERRRLFKEWGDADTRVVAARHAATLMPHGAATIRELLR